MSFITSPGIIVPPLTAGGVAYGTGSQAKMNSAGTVGQVLTSAGAGVPVFTTVASSASVLLSTVTASASATIDIPFSGSYTSFQIIFSDVRPSIANNFIIQYTVNNFASATDWENTVLQALSSGSTNTSTVTAGVILNNQVNSSTSRANGIINVITPLSSGTNKSFVGLVTGDNVANNIYTGHIGGTNNLTNAINGVRFYFATGNVTSGTFKLYGIT